MKRNRESKHRIKLIQEFNYGKCMQNVLDNLIKKRNLSYYKLYTCYCWRKFNYNK